MQVLSNEGTCIFFVQKRTFDAITAVKGVTENPEE